MKLKNARHRNSFNLTTVEFEDFELQSIHGALRNTGNTAIANAITKIIDEGKAKIISKRFTA